MTGDETFHHGASRYDLMVSLNPGYHRHLRAAARTLVERAGAGRDRPLRPLRLLDLACGSGASTRALLDAAPSGTTIVGLDASPVMLDQARAKAWPPEVTFEHGEMGELGPDTLESGGRDGILTCYLLRNVPRERRDRAVGEMFEALAPGGWLVVQEYSVQDRRWARAVWSIVCWLITIPLGTVVGRDFALYRYLWRSVLAFERTDEVEDRLRRAGFEQVSARTVPGWQRGILHTFVARKPEHR